MFFFIAAAPLIFWAAGFFAPFSWASLFLFLGGFFCILWVRSFHLSQALKKLLLSREEAWALCEGEIIVDRVPTFPGSSLSAFKGFLHPESLDEVDAAMRGLFQENLSFKIRVRAKDSEAIYAFEGTWIDGKSILWLKNITNLVHQERLQVEVLQKNESLLLNLQTTLDLLPVLVWCRDENHKITYCNHAYSVAVQASPSKVYEDGIELVLSRSAKPLARKALNTRTPQVSESVTIADGERRCFRVYEIPNPYAQGTLGIAFDITELHEARLEIKRLVDAHGEVLAHLSTAIAVYDTNGVLQYYNQAYIKLYNFDEAFLKTKPRIDEVLEDLRNRRQLPEYADFPAYKKLQLHRLKEQVVPQEEMAHLPDERTLRIFSAPHPMGGLLFMTEDVTDYLTLERRNKALLDAYQATLDNLFEGVVVVGSDNRLKIFNPSFIRLWNLENKGILIGQHLSDVIEGIKDFFDHTEEWESYKANLVGNVTDRVPKMGQLKRKDETIMNFRYVPLPNGDHLISYTDATDTNRVQKALQEKNEALETADRLKAEFISNISHELRSPLNTIIKFSELLSHQFPENVNEPRADYAKEVMESSNKLLHLIDDILDLATIEAGYLTLQPQYIFIPATLKELLSSIQQTEEGTSHIFALKCAKDVERWVIDEKRFKQALLILLQNAAKMTPPKGKITLAAKTNEDELEISVIYAVTKAALKDQTHFYESLSHNQDHSHLNADLGLSLAKNLVELHGGRILVSATHQAINISCLFPAHAEPLKRKEAK